jgi:hypothetical protein
VIWPYGLPNTGEAHYSALLLTSRDTAEGFGYSTRRGVAGVLPCSWEKNGSQPRDLPALWPHAGRPDLLGRQLDSLVPLLPNSNRVHAADGVRAVLAEWAVGADAGGDGVGRWRISVLA